jgi:hypothetical protein
MVMGNGKEMLPLKNLPFPMFIEILIMIRFFANKAKILKEITGQITPISYL